MKTSSHSWNSPDRVRDNTRPEINQRIDEQTRFTVELYRGKPPIMIARRLAQLREEWDIERYLETGASVLALTGVAMGAMVNKKWLFLSGGVLGFLLLHATQGWCPPLPVLRARGVRTRAEIDEEKYGLLELLGSFDPTAEIELDQFR